MFRFRLAILTIMLALAVFFKPVLVVGQSNQPIEIWQATATAPHHDSIVKIILKNGTGTGVVVRIDESKPVSDGYLGYCLTAYHVVKEDGFNGNIRVEYRNGRRATGARTVAFDEANDLALIWVWIPSSIPSASLATVPIEPKAQLEFVGLGGGVSLDCCLRHFTAHAAISSNPNTIFADVALLPGDSGGGVFNQQNQLVGIISGGWFWFQTSSNSIAVQTATWPGRACNLEPIQKLLSKQLGETLLATN